MLSCFHVWVSLSLKKYILLTNHSLTLSQSAYQRKDKHKSEKLIFLYISCFEIKFTSKSIRFTTSKLEMLENSNKENFSFFQID